MTAFITTSDKMGVSAFHDDALVMTCGNPTVTHWLRIKELQNWLTTLEETIPAAPSAHRYHLEQLYFSLKAAYNAHLREHEAIITEAPTADDLQAYLTAYAVAISTASQED
jgi:aminopeptidase-like protein